jgi:hypothetical protein
MPLIIPKNMKNLTNKINNNNNTNVSSSNQRLDSSIKKISNNYKSLHNIHENIPPTISVNDNSQQQQQHPNEFVEIYRKLEEVNVSIRSREVDNSSTFYANISMAISLVAVGFCLSLFLTHQNKK